MKRYKITQYKRFSNANVYTIHEIGAPYSETDNFFMRFKNDSKYSRDIEIIKRWVEQIGERGALERYFKPEGKAHAIPIPPPKSDLRLYAYRISDKILLLGNGGIKTSKKVQDSPDALPHFKLMNSVVFIFELNRQKGKIQLRQSEIKGELEFYLKD